MRRPLPLLSCAFAALVAWLAVAALHDIGLALVAPLAPRFAWMVP